MTNQQLFRRFYRTCRLAAQTEEIVEQLRFDIAEDAARAGFSIDQIHKCRIAALCAYLASTQPVCEPSKQSVSIQLAMFTFGRVTRGRA